MIGAIAGDIIGSVYESFGTKRKDFELFSSASTFTDDTVLTVAVADAVLSGADYGEMIKSYARRYPGRGYGGNFQVWISQPGVVPYHSFGNGSAMRVSPVGYAFEGEDEVLNQAKKTAECTHNHPEGIKGAEATALAVFLARTGADKDSIRAQIQQRCGYDLSRRVDDIRSDYGFDVTCQGSVPEAIICFLDSEDFEDAIRNAVSLGGDADTQGCIAGGIAQAYYREIPVEILREVKKRMAKELWEKTVEFSRKFGVGQIVEQLDSLDGD